MQPGPTAACRSQQVLLGVAVPGVRVGLFLLAMLLGGHATFAGAAQYSEESVKAAFLFRFAGYVEWPTSDSGNGTFTFAIYGADGVATQLEQLLGGLQVHKRPARVVRLTTNADLSNVDILYLGSRSSEEQRSLIARAAARPILIVTDAEDGLTSGSTINFVRLGQNVRFEVSLTAATRSGLKIDSGLLSVAVRVEGRPRANLPCLLGPGPASCGARLAQAILASGGPALMAAAPRPGRSRKLPAGVA